MVLVLRDGVRLLLRVRLRRELLLLLVVVLMVRARSRVQRRVIERRRREGREPSKRGHAASTTNTAISNVPAIGRPGETDKVAAGRGERCRVGRVRSAQTPPAADADAAAEERRCRPESSARAGVSSKATATCATSAVDGSRRARRALVIIARRLLLLLSDTAERRRSRGVALRSGGSGAIRGGSIGGSHDRVWRGITLVLRRGERTRRASAGSGGGTGLMQTARRDAGSESSHRLRGRTHHRTGRRRHCGTSSSSERVRVLSGLHRRGSGRRDVNDVLGVGRPGIHARGVVRVGEVRVPDHGHGGKGGERQVGGRFLHARFRVADDAAATGTGQVGGLEPFRTLHELVLDLFSLGEVRWVSETNVAKRRARAQKRAYFGERAEAALARDGAKVAEDCSEASSQSVLVSLLCGSPSLCALTFLTAESGRVVVDDEAEPLEAVEELDDPPPPLGFLEPDLGRRTLVQRRLHDLMRLQVGRIGRGGGGGAAAPLEGRRRPDVRLLLLLLGVTVTVRRPCERQACEVQVEDGRRHR
jgi:hypothetical protein